MSHKNPNIESSSFNCPYCGTLTHHFWYQLYVRMLDKDKLPKIWTSEKIENILKQDDLPDNARKLFEDMHNKASGQVFYKSGSYEQNRSVEIDNLNISECYTCKNLSVWLREKLIYPEAKFEAVPNPDLPLDIRDDFEEARGVFTLSPRASAALLRLCVQKLCIHLEAKGKDINVQISDLVSKGLDPKIQKALDIVRVIGNNAVHPGEINVKDNSKVATSLFGLVNMIADEMLTRPKELNEMYESLPQGALQQIQKRDA